MARVARRKATVRDLAQSLDAHVACFGVNRSTAARRTDALGAVGETRTRCAVIALQLRWHGEVAAGRFSALVCDALLARRSCDVVVAARVADARATSRRFRAAVDLRGVVYRWRFVATLNVGWYHLQRIQLDGLRGECLGWLVRPDVLPIIGADASVGGIARTGRGRGRDGVAVLNFLLDCAVGVPKLLRILQKTLIALHLAAPLSATVCCQAQFALRARLWPRRWPRPRRRRSRWWREVSVGYWFAGHARRAVRVSRIWLAWRYRRRILWDRWVTRKRADREVAAWGLGP